MRQAGSIALIQASKGELRLALILAFFKVANVITAIVKRESRQPVSVKTAVLFYF